MRQMHSLLLFSAYPVITFWMLSVPLTKKVAKSESQAEGIPIVVVWTIKNMNK